MSFKFLFNITILLLLFNSCSPKNKFNLEKSAFIKFEKAYYENWVSGLKGGGSGLNIYLVLESELKENIQLKGIFFRKEYSLLKFQKLNYYQGFIKTNENWDLEENVFENNTLVENEEKVTEKAKTTSFPFNLKLNEAIISYQEESKIKYFKIVLIKKETSNIPM
ncbi:MAG: hypothetical protein QM478_00675 [Flavobacteriaceae bacterium]